MNDVAQEMMSYYGSSNDDYLEHYGMPRRSGRYPWGSGKDAYQRTIDFLGRIEKLKKDGWTETPENIMAEFGMSTNQYRTQKGLATSERRMLVAARAKSLDEDGLGATAIAKKMSEELGRTVNESTVRSWLNSESEVRMNKARSTADIIRKRIEEKGFVEVGVGVEKELNISKEKLKQALAILEEEGYPVGGGRVDQVTNPGQKTTVKAIGPKGLTKTDVSREIYNNPENIHSLNDYISRDGGDTFEKKFTYPASMDSKRLKIRYADEAGPDGVTGVQKDGVLELRRGVEDLSLGERRYAQVRILVDGDRYLKGMAVYGDNMPDGVDVIFNTNKSKDTPMRKVLKEIKDDPDNPFGSAIKDSEQGGQYWYTDKKTGEKKLGLVNKARDEGDWTEWKDSLPSQFLSKQALPMAKKQLGLAVADKVAEYDSYCELNNPTIKKHLLSKFADECDSAAVHLQAAALPGQKYHVILPVNSLKETEIYAPGYEAGTKLALVRYPHGGTFEIPILTVNNKNADGKNMIGEKSIDAVGINSKVAARLSGADFDGDTVMCIPTHDRMGKVKVTSTRLSVPKWDAKNPLVGLEGFDPTMAYGPEKTEKVVENGKTVEYGYRNGRKYKIMSEKTKQIQMGVASNLITDMTIKGATDAEKAEAVRHSMVVIDAVKHKLDYKQSELDNNISSLKKTYQRTIDEDGNEHFGGASTIISRAKSEVNVDKRQGSPVVNVPGAKYKGKSVYDPTKPEGSLLWQVADDVEYTKTKVNKKTGEVTTDTKRRTQSSTRMAETHDARTLISDTDEPMERAYADYANKMKSLANQARKEVMSTGKIEYSHTAKDTYRPEVASLKTKLDTALLNAPRERQALLKANAAVKTKEGAAADKGTKLTSEERRKAGQQALTRSRDEVGSVSRSVRSIKITDREWEAIQAGAISETTLKRILNNTDVDELRRRATPRAATTVSTAQLNKIKMMSNSNYTLQEISKSTGIPTSTVSNYLKGVK